VKSINIYLLFILTIFPLLGCQKSNKSTAQIDNKSYINDFELLQENPNKETSVKITSPKAIIDPTINDIEIYESSIEIMNENGIDFQVESGNATLNNLSNNIRVFNNSKDASKSHVKFIDKHQLPFTLLTDSEPCPVATSYESYGLKKFMGREYYGMMRHTFVIDKEGKIELIYLKVKSENMANQVLSDLKLN